jgi:hypothetical protein
MAKHFWVIGGEYRCGQSQEAIPGSERVFGPFRSQRDARSVWRARAGDARGHGTIRYSIVETPANPARELGS